MLTSTDPNGTWQLFLFDDSASNGEVHIEGWNLTITAQMPA
jgi:hypothetical protein